MIIQKNNGREKVVRIHLYLNTICNLKCSYCYMRNGDSWGRSSKKDYINEFVSKIKDINIPIDLILLGGEPTYYPHLDYLLNELTSIKNIRDIFILSNGTRDFQNYKNLQEKFSNVNLYLTYHSTEYIAENFINNCINLDTKRTFINILIDDINFDYNNIINSLTKFKTYGTYLYDMNNNFITDSKYLNILKQYQKSFEKYISIDNKYYNDIDIVLNHLNLLSNIKCYNNNLYCNLHTNDIVFYQNCTDKIKNINDINSLHFDTNCPLQTCSCQGLLSDYKES